MADIKQILEQDDINFKKLLSPIFLNFKLFRKFFIFFLAVGFFIAFFSKKEYESSMIFSIDGPSKNINGFSGIAALTGLNLNSLNNDYQLNISDYPLIFKSIPYKQNLTKLKFSLSNFDKQVTLEEYFRDHNKPSLVSLIKKYTIGIPMLLNDFKNNLIVRIKGNSTNNSTSPNNSNKSIVLTKEKLELYALIDNHINVQVDEVSGNITLVTTLYDPLASTELLNNAYIVLKELVIEYKLKKAREEYDFLLKQFNERKKQFEIDEQNLNYFSDSNLNIKSNQFNSLYNSLQSKYNISFSFYNEISKQLEAQKIKLERENPNFTVFQPGYVPIKFSKPQRLKIIFSYILYGFIFYVIYVYYPFLKESFKSFIK